MSSYSSGGYQSNSRYGGSGGTRDDDSFRDSYRDRDRSDEEKAERDTFSKSRRGVTSENQGSNLKEATTRYGRYMFY